MAAVAVGFTKAVLRVSAAGQRSAGVGGLRRATAILADSLSIAGQRQRENCTIRSKMSQTETTGDVGSIERRLHETPTMVRRGVAAKHQAFQSFFGGIAVVSRRALALQPMSRRRWAIGPHGDQAAKLLAACPGLRPVGQTGGRN